MCRVENQFREENLVAAFVHLFGSRIPLSVPMSDVGGEAAKMRPLPYQETAHDVPELRCTVTDNRLNRQGEMRMVAVYEKRWRRKRSRRNSYLAVGESATWPKGGRL